MNLYTLLKKVGFLVLLVTFISSVALGQTFVNNTNGDDLNGDGSSGNPYKTIAKAIAVTTAGGTISVASDVYGEATVNVTKALTFVATTFNALSTVTITNGMTINTANTADVVNLGVTGQKFNLGTTITALNLTKGNLQITGSNVILGSAARITRIAGTLDNNPTTTNINVRYTGTADLTSGGELPSNLGLSGLTVLITAGKKLTIGHGLTASGGITVNTGNLDITGNLVLSTSAFNNVPAGNTVNITGNIDFTPGGAITNTNSGSLTVSGTVTWTAGAVNLGPVISNMGSGTFTLNGAVNFTGTGTFIGSIRNNGTGTLTLAQGFTTNPAGGQTITIAANNNSSGNLTFNGAATIGALTNNAGTITLTGGTVSGTVANNTALGTIDVKANTTFSGATIGNGNINSTIKLNGNTLTLSNAGATVTNNGNIISTTAGTIGAGVLAITGATTINGGGGAGEVPNVTVSSTLNVNGVTAWGNLTSAGTVTLTGAFTLRGNYDQNVGGTLVFGANTFTSYGNWTRVSNGPGDVTWGTGTLLFTGASAQTFTSGASLTLYNVTINKTNTTDIVTLAQSVSIRRNLTITKGKLALGSNNVRMTTAGGSVVNTGGYTSSGIGFIIFEANSAISGTATFSNIDVRGGATVTAGSAINFSGKMNLRQGVFANGANAFLMKNDLVNNPSITLYSDGVGIMTGSTVTVAAGVTYDLTYTSAATGNVTAGKEWALAGIRNLSVSTAGTSTITGPAGNTSIAGAFSVSLNQTLELDNVAARTLTLAGASQTHTVTGMVKSTGGASSVIVTGNANNLNGTTSTAVGSFADVPNLTITITAAQTFNSTNLKKITGTFTVANGTAVVTMNTTTANITGVVTLTAGSLNLNMASTASAQGGNLVLTAGTMTYTRGSVAAQQIIGGTVLLTAGTFTLGSNVSATGVTTQVAGNLALGAFNYTAKTANYVRTGAGTVTGTGRLIVGGITLTPGATFKVPNLELDGAVTIGAAMEVTNSLTHTSGAVNYSNLTFSGNTYTYVAGTITAGGPIFTGTAVIATFSANVTFPVMTINTTGSVTIAGNPAATARTITVTAFTQTKGDVNLGIHSLQTNGFTRVAGNWTMTSGFLNMNAAAPTFGATGFAVDNLRIMTGVNAGTAAFTVNRRLILSGALTTSADGKLTMGSGARIDRSGNGFTLSKKPTFGAAINLFYVTAGTITTGNEVPTSTTVLNNVTVQVSTTLGAAMTINGTLTLTTGVFTSSVGKEVTIASGGTIIRTAGTMARAPVVTSYNLTYNGAAGIGDGPEFVTSKVANLTISLTGGVNFTLSQNFTITGNFSLSPGAAGSQVNLSGKNLTVAGNVTITSNGNFTNSSATTSKLTFSGAAAQTFTVPAAGFQIPATGTTGAMELVLNNTVTAGVTLTGGNLTIVNLPVANTSIVRFINGVLKTGTNVLTMWQANNGVGQPLQGFDRTGVAAGKYSHIVGNVKKFVNKANTVDISQVIFPVGTLPTSPGNYRPLSIFFKTAPQSSVNLTVNEVDASPGGSNGIPLNTGSLTITNYPDFFWYVKSDQALNPSYQYDMELQAQGYTDYQTDGIQNIRMIRRDSGNVANPWVMQGTDNSYDNSTINSTWPVLKVINAQGGITTQGSRFTYSQNNKAPVFTAALGNTTVAEGDSVLFTYTATDADLGQTPTLSSVTMPTGATFNTSTGAFKWVTTGSDSGSHTVTIRASDGTVNTDTTVTITVTDINQKPTFTVAPTDTTNIAEGVTSTFQYTATDPDADNASLTYSIVPATPAPDSLSINSSTGLLTIIPNFTESGNVYSITVRVTDSANGTTDTTVVYKVTGTNRAPVYNTAMADTSVDEAATLTLDFGANASDPDSDALTYAFTLKLGGGLAIADSGAIVAATGVYTWTPKYTQAGVYELVVTASDASLSASDTVAVTVNNKNAAPTWATNGELTNQTISAGDSLNFNYKADDLDNDPIVYAFVGNHPSEATINASTGAFLWVPATSLQFPVLITISATDGTDTIQTQAQITVTPVTGIEDVNAIPENYELSQNYPNPFNPATTIKYALTVTSQVSIIIYNNIGQKVVTLVDGSFSAGFKSIQFNASNIASGIYFYRIIAKGIDGSDFLQTKKMILLK